MSNIQWYPHTRLHSGSDSDTQRLTYPTHPLRMWLTPGNRIGDAGARSLADGLKELKGLKKLRLACECVLGCWRSPTVANDTRTHHPPGVVVGLGGCVVDGRECDCSYLLKRVLR